MSVSNVSNANLISQLAQLNRANHTNRSGSTEGANGAKPARAGGSFVDAIAQALSQVGLDTTSAATSGSTSEATTSTAASTDSPSTTTNDPAQALSSFLQNLMAALQAQAKPVSGNAHDNRDGEKGEGSSTQGLGNSGASRRNMHADLQSLIHKLSSAETPGTSSTETQQNALQQSFQSLVEALGGSGGNTTLPGFLKTLASNVPGASMLGGIVSILA